MRLHGSVGGQKAAFSHEPLVLREPDVDPLGAAESRAFTAERKELRGAHTMIGTVPPSALQAEPVT